MHHKILLNILRYLPLIDIVTKVSRFNRKLYIVSGDLSLLQTFSNKKDLKQ